MNEELRKIFREHPALIVSSFYVAASAVGMFYSWAYLRHFSVNVFNYAQISDFLIASLKEPITWALVVIAVVLVQLDNAMSRRVGRKQKQRWWSRWYGARLYRQINDFVVVGIVAMFIYGYAGLKAIDTRKGEGKAVTVIFADNGTASSALLLGTTGQFVFLYGVEAEHVDIHPIENIHSISFEAPTP